MPSCRKGNAAGAPNRVRALAELLYLDLYNLFLKDGSARGAARGGFFRLTRFGGVC